MDSKLFVVSLARLIVRVVLVTRRELLQEDGVAVVLQQSLLVERRKDAIGRVLKERTDGLVVEIVDLDPVQSFRDVQLLFPLNRQRNKQL